MSYWFFFSYAHADQDDFLDMFYKDLSKEVRGMTGVKVPESGFIDRKDIEHGADWEQRLGEGLRTSRVFIPIYTPSYFLSEYCGKEFEVFRDRVRANLKVEDGAAEPLILPVLWNQESNVRGVLPKAVGNIQYTHGDYPPEYLTEGVLQLARLGVNTKANYYNQYWEFVRKFANAIKAAGDKYPLKDEQTLRPLSEVTGLFSTATQAAPRPGTAGPRYVQFIFVAGKQSELAGRREEVKFYGEKGGSDWLPYLDSYSGTAATLAIEAVKEVSKDLNYEEVTLTGEIDKQVKQAAREDKIVVVVVDTWTLRLKHYKDLVAPLDEYSSLNCITMILWNDEDKEAAVHKSTLETMVNGTFTTKIEQGQPNFFRSIKSYETFKKELVKALARAQSQVVARAETQKIVDFAIFKTPQAAKFETKPSL